MATQKKAPAKRAAAGKAAGASQRPAPEPRTLEPMSESLRSEPGTKRGRATRERLLAAARAVFETRGFLDTNVSDICAEASAAHGTFYIYFKSKEDIFYALVDRTSANRQQTTTVPADVEGTVADRFAYTLRQYFADIHANSRWTRIVEQVATLDDKMREHRLEIRKDFRDRILHGIQRLQDQGLADPGMHAEITAEAIVSMLHNFAYMNIVMTENDSYELEDVVETLTQVWARAIGLDLEHLPRRSAAAAG
ncbi:TetR/AcrR family transcriptional regulator [Amycolatopsis benzoatilytica]|uniref:TetR/AcrR family transcriptional regulator n=1 Tax=Amycolatopsis benzoatilytica TaxID=346045 RepID=UPI00037961E7|nr:TetR/AcrR family transcriptional regulator [Amycolatopsis benzoatilytica]